MWKVGDLVKQRPSIFRIDAVGGKPMLVVDVIYSKGKASGWPVEVITECDGRLYHWKGHFSSDALLKHHPKAVILNDLPLGRNIDEMLRTIDALDHHNAHGEVCPAGWNKGKTAMKPSHDGMRSYLQEESQNL